MRTGRARPHPSGTERYALYLRELQTFAVQQGVPFIDLANGDIASYRDDALFADFHHMTPDAAVALTKDLAAVFVQQGVVGASGN